MPGRGCSKDRHRRAERTVLKNCRKITETLGQERDMSSEEKRKKNWNGESALSTRRNGQEPLRVVEKPFPAVGRLDTT